MCFTSITKCKTFSRFNVLKYMTVFSVFGGRGEFTFNGLFIVVLMYLVVPLYSHATKPTPTPLKSPQIIQKSFDPPLRTKPNYPLPKLTPPTSPKEPQQTNPIPHPLSPTPPNYPASPKL